MLQKLKIMVFFALILTSQISLAKVSDLLNSRTRPTMADVEREMQNQGDKLEPLNDHTFLSHHLVIANLIAELEWAYPGAIYMPLGRDVVVIGDVIDAFYRSQGQPGRVIRLNASGQSLHVSDELIARFVQSSGVDIKNLTKGPGYIFFDGSNYSLPRGSQSTKILNAVYNYYVNQGGHAKDILTKFAFFNLYSHGSGAVQVHPDLNREAFLKEQYDHLERHPMGIPQKTFTASHQPYGSSEWHSNFNLLTEMPDGSVVAPPPAQPNHEATRREILLSMTKMMAMVQHPKFIEAIQKRAKELGYEFKLKKPSCDGALE